MGGVALSEIDVTNGVIYLVQVVLVLIRCCHALQAADHLLCLARCHHLRHCDAGIELHLVRRVLGYHLLIGFIGLLLVSELRLQLSEQEVFASLLALTHLVLDDLAQIGNGLCIVAGVDVVVGERVVPFLLGAPVNGVAAHVADDVLGIVDPVLLNIALGKPGACPTVDGGLRGVEATHVVEGGGGFVEGTLVELRAAHEHPCLPEERVVFLSRQPLQVALRLAALLVPFRLMLDAMQLNGLLTFLDGFLVVSLANLLRLLVANGVEGNDFGEVILVAVFLFQRGVDVGKSAVVVSIISSIERVPPTALRSILLRRTSCHQSCQNQQQEQPYGIFLLNLSLLFDLLYNASRPFLLHQSLFL